MVIRLKVENLDRLPDGTPATFETDAARFAIGREGRDWNLPDPDLFISGRHCEVRCDNGVFWLHDVSRNGTFVNGSNVRLGAPHRLSHGDRIKIGRYVISVAIAAAAAPAPPAVPARQAAPSFSFDDDAFLKSAPPVQELPRVQPLQTGQPHSTPPGHGEANASQAVAASEFLWLVATGAGVSPAAFAGRDEREIAFEIGAVLKTAVEETALLLKARAAAKVLAKSSQRTMIGAADNNPLKFLPTTDEMLEVMFARRRPGYLDARRALQDAFGDLKTHEVATYAAMQSALSRLLDDLSPHTVEKRLPSSAFGSKKARSWEALVALWEAKEAAHENGLLDVFLAYFSEAYAKATKKT